MKILVRLQLRGFSTLGAAQARTEKMQQDLFTSAEESNVSVATPD